MQLNHIIIGAGRSGTTSLVAYLKQHPEINFSAIKEVTYFSVEDHYKRGTEFLNSFFNKKDGKINATSDTYLLMDENAPKRIADYNSEIKITLILRDPSVRTLSIKPTDLLMITAPNPAPIPTTILSSITNRESLIWRRRQIRKRDKGPTVVI